MKEKNITRSLIVVLLSALVLFNVALNADQANKETEISLNELEKKVTEFMAEGDIPGLSLVIIRGGKPDYIKSFGFADLETKKPVTPGTIFEIASCSKAFTALAALKLEKEGLIDLDAPVSRYLPWFYTNYKGKKQEITLRQCLHQTSGIPFKSISRIPVRDDDAALQDTVKNLAGIELADLPGKKHEYATINYDIIGAIIEAVSGMPYEEYMAKNIFPALGLHSTFVGVNKNTTPGNMAVGYKISFFAPRRYDSPIYRGNNPAGYIISNAKDIARWLRLQMKLEETEFTPLILKSQQRDETVPPLANTLLSYAMGWYKSVSGNGIIEHAGDNPNFTAHIVFNPAKRLGVAVLANSNSQVTRFIAYSAMIYMRGEGHLKIDTPSSRFDKPASVFTIIMILFILTAIFYVFLISYETLKKRRTPVKVSFKFVFKQLVKLLMFVPYLLGIYFLPKALMDVTWQTAFVWAPQSFKVTIQLVLLALIISYVGIVLSALLPHGNKYKRSVPLVIILSLLSGVANAVVIFLVTGSVFSKIPLFYQVYNYFLAFLLYIWGRKVLQTRLIKLTYDIVFDTRMKLVEKIFHTTYQKFEKLERGRVYATLNDDTGVIGNSAQILVTMVTSFITAVGAFIYLATIAFWATLVTLMVVIVVATLYSIVIRRARNLLEQARDSRDEYMGLLNGLVDGFKELSMQYNKRKEYTQDLALSSDIFRTKLTKAFLNFLNAFLVGESLLIVVLGAVSFGVPRIFPNISTATIMSFIMVLLYLIGPLNGILNSIPNMLNLKVAWGRVQKFMKAIPANIDPKEIDAMDHSTPESIDRIEAKGVIFQYETRPDEPEKGFSVGPIDFEAEKGDVIFIIGGNGSGKTTFAKILTGLYIPGKGTVKIDGREINNVRLGEYYSTVFSDYHLFKKLYNVDVDEKREHAKKYLKQLRLQEKVVLEEKGFSTLNLSGGQKKRLALLQCYLEDAPIYLFDEVAADQDPEFRKFFYRRLLPEMKQRGKIVIAITHDDHYFDAADKVIKFDFGKVDEMDAGERFRVTI